ncbi:hypothetical protein GWI33_013285 [Rhynchophorus ferrugineus]|uniref:Uncharacterized protein n=1 Tax=Rhynchophorus ferrugineus TaxID=354439 RepID=A0A834I9K7_RHYFE|nr:hypothetical protein GWI33_013285 [Rhynchophorus ferrugineus]
MLIFKIGRKENGGWQRPLAYLARVSTSTGKVLPKAENVAITRILIGGFFELRGPATTKIVPEPGYARN